MIQYDEELGATITAIGVLHTDQRCSYIPLTWQCGITKDPFASLRNRICSDSLPSSPNRRQSPSPISEDSNAIKIVSIRLGVTNLSGTIRHRLGYRNS